MGLLGCTSRARVRRLERGELRPRVPGARGRGQRVPSFVSVQGSLCMFPIWKFGSEEQKQRWLPPARGEDRRRPDRARRGLRSRRMRTSARRDGDGWVPGTKMWITNGSVADRDRMGPHGRRIRGFLVPTESPGFSASDVHRKPPAPRATSELVLDEVRLPGDAVLPGVTGMKGPLSCLTEAVRHRVVRWARLLVLRVGARVREDARPMGQADRRVPAHATQARGHGARAQQGPCSRCTSGG